MAAVIAVQGLVTMYLVGLKLIADSELAGGLRRYDSPFQQVMYTIDWAGAVTGLCAMLVAFLVPPQRRVDDAAAWLGRNVSLVAAVVVALFATASCVVHQGYPLTMDEFAPYLQSQVFARGRLVGQWPPPLVPLLVAAQSRDGFLFTSLVTGEICSGYAPGHALLLTPFTALGMPWMCNPVLAGCAILLIAAVARRVFGDPAAGWAVLFAVSSPVFAAYGISFYAMMSHLTLNLLYVLLVLNPTLPRVAAAGIVGGFALVLHNPFPHAVFALPWLGWLAMRRDRWTRLPVIGLCYAAVFLPIEAVWRSIQDDIRSDRPVATASTFPGTVAAAAKENTGADPVVAASPAPDSNEFVRAWNRILGQLSVLQISSFADILQLRLLSFVRLVAWDAPGLVVIATLGLWRCRRLTAARLVACSAVSTFLGYGLIAMSGGHGWGYRYFFSCWSCLPLLASGLAADRTQHVRPGDEGSATPEPTPVNFLRTVGLAAMLGLALGLPVRLWQIHAFISEHLAQLPPLPTNITTIGSGVIRFVDPDVGYFRHDLIRNEPFFETGPYIFVSLGAEGDAIAIQALAEMNGVRARKLAVDARGSTWVLEGDNRPPAKEEAHDEPPAVEEVIPKTPPFD